MGRLRSYRPKPCLSAKVCWSGSQLRVPVVLGGEAVVGVGEVQGDLVVAQHSLLLLLRAVVQRVGVHLLDVPLDGADLQRGQSGSAHDADQPVSPAVVVHQVLHPPAHLVVPPLVLPGVMAVARRRGRGAAVLRFHPSSTHTVLLLHRLTGCRDIWAGVLTCLSCSSFSKVDFCKNK